MALVQLMGFGVFVILVILERGHAQEQIPETNLFTDTRYQIHQNGKKGFNILTTYGDRSPVFGERFVQLDTQTQRESNYTAGGDLFEDGLWTFKRVNAEDPFVTISNVKYPDLIFVLEEDDDSPSGTITPSPYYIILTKYSDYVDQGKELAPNRKFGFWILLTEGNALQIQNVAYPGKVATALPQWSTSTMQTNYWLGGHDKKGKMYNFIINGV